MLQRSINLVSGYRPLKRCVLKDPDPLSAACLRIPTPLSAACLRIWPLKRCVLKDPGPLERCVLKGYRPLKRCVLLEYTGGVKRSWILKRWRVSGLTISKSTINISWYMFWAACICPPTEPQVWNAECLRNRTPDSAAWLCDKRCWLLRRWMFTYN